MTSEAAQAFVAWFHQMDDSVRIDPLEGVQKESGGVQTETGEAQPGQDQAAPESAAPSYPVVSDGGELSNVTHEASAAEQFTEWFHRVI